MSNDPYPNNAGQPPYDHAPPPRKSRTWLWVLGILAGLGFLCIAVCCGLGFYGYNMASTMMVQPFQNSPVIQEQLGGIDDSSMNIQATGEYQQQNQGSNHVVFDVSGPNGSGQLAIEQSPGATPTRAVLIMSDGSEYPIDVGGGEVSDEDMDFEIDTGEIQMEDADTAAP